jgi:NarL family two-component system sensor histidine kinase LiaS
MANADRIRLAQELHDGIAQDLVSVGYSLDLLLSSPQMPVETRIQLRTLRFTVTEIIEKVRREMFELRELTNMTLGQHIQNDALRICDGLTISLSIEDDSLNSDGEPANEIAKICRELLRNIVTHAQATSASISLTKCQNEIVLTVRDNGHGGADETLSRQGIKGIRERAQQIGASFSFQSDESGTDAVLRYPVTSWIHDE